jgi:hypothetical protein
MTGLINSCPCVRVLPTKRFQKYHNRSRVRIPLHAQCHVARIQVRPNTPLQLPNILAILDLCNTIIRQDSIVMTYLMSWPFFDLGNTGTKLG